MITSAAFTGKSYGVLGRGKAGRAAIEALKASGATVYSWDDGMQEAEDTPIADWPWQELSGLVMSPGIALTHAAATLAKQHQLEILGDVELLFRAQPDATYIGITGTNGKSTTTALIGHILQEAGRAPQVGGNLGTPAMALSPSDLYVLEMSSYQLELMRSVRFDIAVWLNLSPDHLDRHGDMAGYKRAKEHIFDRQTPDSLAVVGVDDEVSGEVAKGCIAKVKHISLRDELSRKLADAKALQGEHNHQNASAAYAVCEALGVEHEVILAAMHNFPGLAHRMQYVTEKNGVIYVNDSKATNAEAAEKSLRSYENIFWLAGGVAKQGGIEMLHEYFPKIKQAYLFGEAKDLFAATLGDGVQHAIYDTMAQAFAAAQQDAEEQGGVLLLAPACASFDQFSSFEERGEKFVELVKKVDV